MFESDLHNIILHLEKNSLTEKQLYESSGIPEIFKLYLGGYVTIETMVILDHYANYLANNSQINLLLGEEYLRIEKCKGFIKFDKDKLLQVYLNFKQELDEL